MDEVLAHAGAALEQVVHGRVDVCRALAVLEPIGDQLGDQAQHRQRGRSRARGREQLDHRGVMGGVVGLEQELAARLAVVRIAQRFPRCLGRLGWCLRDHARADVNRQLAVRPGDLELDDVRAEVVGVTVQPDLGCEPDAELVTALPGSRRRLHAERVQVVDDVAVVLVAREIANREVHLDRSCRALQVHARRVLRSRSSGLRCRGRSARALPVPVREFRLNPACRGAFGAGARGRRSAVLGAGPAGRSAAARRRPTARRAAPPPTRRQSRGRRRRRAGTGPLEPPWGHRAPPAGTPAPRRRSAAARSPRSRVRRARTRAGTVASSIRSTMSACSIRPPASRNARPSSRSIVRSTRPQNSAHRSLTSW